MTSASELFYNRRSRFGRNSNPLDVGLEFGSHPSVDRGNRRHRNHHPSSTTRRDRDPDACDPLRRAPHQLRQQFLHRSSHSPHERDLIRLEPGSHPLAFGNGIHSGNQNTAQDRVRLRGNDRLPGAVLLARERLSRRLGAVTLSSGRLMQGRHSSPTNELSIGDELWLIDAGDWETDISRDWLSRITSTADSTNQQMTRRPPGLSQDALNCLPTEAFHEPEEGLEEGISTALKDCSICLESFLEGDNLICLPCGHSYHVCCLKPWVRACGDCPYCRRSILLT